MRLPIADPVIDWAALLDVLWVSLLGGVGVTSVFAVFILGSARAAEVRRDGHRVFAGAYATLAAVAFAVVVAAVVLGIVFMTSKD